MFPCAQRWMLPAKAQRLTRRGQTCIQALELFFETADPSEIQSRMHSEVFVTRLEVAIG